MNAMTIDRDQLAERLLVNVEIPVFGVYVKLATWREIIDAVLDEATAQFSESLTQQKDN